MIGTGFAGLTLGNALQQDGIACLLIDKGRSPGGRAATRRLDSARVDHGIPWLTRTGGESDRLIDGLREARLIERIYVGGTVGDAWVAPAGITSATKHLASGLDVRFSSRVESVEAGEANRLLISDADGREYGLAARHVVITAPVPQAMEISTTVAEAVGEVDPDAIYEKAVIGLARLAHSSAVPDTVLIENPADGIESVIIESAKFPDRPPSISIRCDPRASDLLFAADDDYAWSWMAGRLADLPLLASEPAERQVKRWRYSKPANPVDAPFIRRDTPGGSISACGDGFDSGAETGLESALRSARALLEYRPW